MCSARNFLCALFLLKVANSVAMEVPQEVFVAEKTVKNGRSNAMQVQVATSSLSVLYKSRETRQRIQGIVAAAAKSCCTRNSVVSVK